MMTFAVTAISSSSLSYSPLLLHSQGPNRRLLHWKRNEKRRLATKVAGSGVITAGFELKPPPYPLDALEPHMSRETLDYHWGKHHRTYVENLNKQIVGTDLDALSLEEVVLLSYNRGNMLPAFNNAAKNRRAEYINTFMEKLVSWETVNTRLEAAMVRATQREQEGTDTEEEANPDDEEPEVYLDSDIDVSEVD
ncbi:PREDICTED: superoxide dismutase [Fe] 2, chloroplastic-like [Camelina sativa]|uniref:superoxide dismutase n=1 Tax=Camelina sativa TaxID=90675 RepID=A0ABM0TX17_CAMSA|nr:PREDICTED: superoxide dismutase [Fe] 2, chloroplastic-like [Camelina sativa]